MEALLWLASAAPGAGSTGVDKLLDRILGLERAHWGKLLGALDDDGVRDLARGVGQVTLVQGVEFAAGGRTAADGRQFYGETHSRASPSILSCAISRSSTAVPTTASPSSSPT